MKKVTLASITTLALISTGVATQIVSAAPTTVITSKGKASFTKDDNKVGPTIPGTTDPEIDPEIKVDPKSPIVPGTVEASQLGFSVSQGPSFNFGENKISAEDLVKPTITYQALAEAFDGTKYYTAAEEAESEKEYKALVAKVKQAEAALATANAGTDQLAVDNAKKALEQAKKDERDYNYKISRQAIAVYDGRLDEDGLNWSVKVSATPFVSDKDDPNDASKKYAFAGAKIIVNNTKTTVRDEQLANKADLVTPTGNKFTIQTDGATSQVFGTMKDKKVRFHSNVSWKPEDVSLEVAGSQVKTGAYESTITWTLEDKPAS